MKKKILYIDMDDTICQFKEAYAIAKLLVPEIIYPQSQYGFFLNLDPIEDAIESIKLLMETYDVYILTRPSYKNPLCYTEKRVWIEKYFGLEFCKKLIICYDKSLLKGDILIDDVEWNNFEGEQILFGSENFRTWKQVINHLTK